MWVWARWMLSLLLQPGGAPQHVAFIMDGNRRFAAGHSIQKIQGHRAGYKKMVDVIHWCVELGVRFISVYAFSIDNFARSLEEVEALMQLAEDKYEELTQEDGLAERKGIEVRIIGDLSLAPPTVQASANRLMQKTAALPAKQAVLNICFSYSSREELILSMDTLQQGIMDGTLQPQDVTIQKLQHCMRTQSCPPVDIVIRTSGETRASDFLLWQSAHAHLMWESSMWPDWTYLSFVRCILKWQLSDHHRQRVVKAAAGQLQDTLGMRLPPSSLAEFTSPGQSKASSVSSSSHTQSAASADGTSLSSPQLLSASALASKQCTHVVRRRAVRKTSKPVRGIDDTPLANDTSCLAPSHADHCYNRSDSNSSNSNSSCQGPVWELPFNWAPHTFGPIVHALSKLLADLLRFSPGHVFKQHCRLGNSRHCANLQTSSQCNQLQSMQMNRCHQPSNSIQMRQLHVNMGSFESRNLLPPNDSEMTVEDVSKLHLEPEDTLNVCSELSDHSIQSTLQHSQQHSQDLLTLPLEDEGAYLMPKSDFAVCNESAAHTSLSVQGITQSDCSSGSPCVSFTPTTPSSTPPSSPRTDHSMLQPRTCSDVADSHSDGFPLPPEQL